MAYSYSVDKNGNIYKDGKFVSANNYKYLEQDPGGQKALSAARDLKSGSDDYSGWSTSRGWVGGSSNNSSSNNSSSNNSRDNNRNDNRDNEYREEQRTNNQSAAPKNTVDEIISQLSQLSSVLGQYSAPYEQMYRDLIANYPQTTAPTEEEMLQQSSQWANLQIDPQAQALQRALDQARLSAQNQKADLEANYASFEDTTNRMLEQAGQRATESAIARGGGRSGAVEWLNNQYATPIMEQATTQQAKRTANLNALSEALALAEQQGSQQMQQLEARRGELGANRLAELRNLSQATQAGDWSRIAQATQNLMALATQANQFNQTFASNLLPYLMPTVGQEMDQNINLLNSTGEVSEGLSSYTPVSLRSYAADRGVGIGYDPATKSIIINGKKYSPGQLQQMGGQLENGSWMIPQSAVNGLF